MIIRIFRVEIHPEFRQEFEEKFFSLSVEALDNQSGCLSIETGKPVGTMANEYSMISKWQSQEALVDFLGDNWEKAFIPEGMEKFAKNYSVHHYQLV